MQIVTLTRDMRPWRSGQDAVLPDEIAAKLVDSGEAKDPRPFPPPDMAPNNPVRDAQLQPKRYFTRKRG